MTTTASKKSAPAKKTSHPDAIALLKADHKEVSDMFEAYEKTRSTSNKKTLVDKICAALTVHAQVEEEIFYPTVQPAIRDKELVPEARVEHASLKDLIAQIEGVEPDGEMFDAKVKVLSEYVKHHVKEEQNEMFPKVKASSIDLDALGLKMAERKEALMAEHA